jgi:hypothetical protein
VWHEVGRVAEAEKQKKKDKEPAPEWPEHALPVMGRCTRTSSSTFEYRLLSDHGGGRHIDYPHTLRWIPEGAL